MNQNGDEIKQVSSAHRAVSNPIWSPDGQHIVYTYYRGLDDPTKIAIISMGLFGTNETIVNPNKGQGYMQCGSDSICPNDEHPTWSPASDMIAFVDISNKVKNNANICIADLDGIVQQCLTTNAGENKSPAWSPNGKHNEVVKVFRQEKG